MSVAAPIVSYVVNVTNTGAVDADDVVLGFMQPPGAGENGVPRQTLFGFERVHIRAGESRLVYMYPSLTDWTQVCIFCVLCYLFIIFYCCYHYYYI